MLAIFRGYLRGLLTVAVPVIALAMAVPSGAFALTGMQSAAVNAVLAQANQTPAAQNPAQADQYRAELQPAVNAAIASGGNQAINALIRSKDPNVVAAVATNTPITLGQPTSSVPSGIAPPANIPGGLATAHVRRTGVHAHAAGCWGTVWYNQPFQAYSGGPTIAWIQTNINGWCGNGSSITWYGGASFPYWWWGPYCLTNVAPADTNFSWDVPFSWLHAGYWSGAGVNYAFGCLSFHSGHATVRVAANGYADAYDDFGY